jgi:predicted  nucleic acid-binding Zn-ribbon protein
MNIKKYVFFYLKNDNIKKLKHYNQLKKQNKSMKQKIFNINKEISKIKEEMYKIQFIQNNF